MPSHSLYVIGTQVAVVNNGKAEIRKVKVTRDLGTRVEVISGIKAGDQVILNPPVNLLDGRPDSLAITAAEWPSNPIEMSRFT